MSPRGSRAELTPIYGGKSARLMLAVAILGAVAWPGVPAAAGYAGSGGQAAPGQMAGGASAPEAEPEPAPLAVTPSAPESEAVPAREPRSVAPDAPDRRRSVPPPAREPAPAAPAAPAAVLPAVSLRAVPARNVVRLARTPVAPQPGARPGKENAFVLPVRPEERPELPRAQEATEPGLTVSSPRVVATLLAGALILAVGIAGLATARARELAAA
jgi:hypothetical protein